MININIDVPNWADIIQAIAALVAVPGAIVAFFVLFKSDKARESEILSLSNIATQLTQMQSEAEKRYKSSKKPLIHIKLNFLKDENKIRIDFINTNQNSNLRSYTANTHLDGFTLSTTTINQQNTNQLFGIGVSYKAEPPEYLILHMDYITEEGYTFIQEISIWFDGDKFVFAPSVIIDKSNSF